MAENDSTRPTASDPTTDEQAPARGMTSDGDARDPGDTAVTGIAQRHELPRRKASTLPDLSRSEGVGNDETRPQGDGVRATSDGARDGDGDGDGDGDESTGSAAGNRQDHGTPDPDGHADRAAGVDPADHPEAQGDAPATADGSSPAVVGSSAAVPAASPDHARPRADDQGVASAEAVPAVTEDVDDARAGAAATEAVPAVDDDDGARAAPAVDERPTADADDSGPAVAAGGGSHAAAPAEEPSTDTAALALRPPDSDVARRAAARDHAADAKPALARFLQVVVALFFPVIVVAGAVRAVATSSFLWLEYHRPGFPADSFGFSLDDRMTYGSYALDYVLNFAPPRYLGGLVTPEGEPLFLESEVGHMADVKGVLGVSFLVALVLLVLAVLACVYLARRYKGGIRRALFSGAVLTLVGIVTLTVLAVLAWETFFTQVHALFFADGTWTFRLDDTLIRLFPEQFWTDAAVTIAVLVLAATLLTLVLAWPTKARRDRSMLAQYAAQARYREALDAS